MDKNAGTLRFWRVLFVSVKVTGLAKALKTLFLFFPPAW